MNRKGKNGFYEDFKSIYSLVGWILDIDYNIIVVFVVDMFIPFDVNLDTMADFPSMFLLVFDLFGTICWNFAMQLFQDEIITTITLFLVFSRPRIISGYEMASWRNF